MTDESVNLAGSAPGGTSAPDRPAAVDRATFQAELDRLRVREKAHPACKAGAPMISPLGDDRRR